MAWHVTAQRETSTIGPSGQVTPSVEVHFLTDAGVAGKVTVPKTAFSAETVKERIDGYVAHLDAVGDLSG